MSVDHRILALIDNPRQREQMEREAEGLPAPTENAERPAICELVVNLVDHATHWTAQCPACAANKQDQNKRDHLIIYPPDGKFACVIHQGDDGREHRRQIAKLLGLKPGKRGGRRVRQRDLTAEKAAVEEANAELWKAITEELSGGIDDLGPSAEIPSELRDHFLTWCRLWLPDDLAWCGWKKMSPEHFRSHVFRPADPAEAGRMWAQIVHERLDVCRGYTVLPEAASREQKSFGLPRFIPVEHDGAELPQQIALIRYAKDVLEWPLRMVVHSGNKSIHGIFDPSEFDLDRIRRDVQHLHALGADKNALRNSASRIPGAIRRGDEKHPGGTRQTLLWINPTFTTL